MCGWQPPGKLTGALAYKHASDGAADVTRKEKTTPVGVIQEKLMVNADVTIFIGNDIVNVGLPYSCFAAL